MARNLEPAPLEPAGMLGETTRRCRRVPLMHTAWIEKERPADLAHVTAMRVPIHDHVCVWKTAPQAARKPAVRLPVSQAQRPQQRGGLPAPARAIAVHQGDALARK